MDFRSGVVEWEDGNSAKEAITFEGETFIF